MEGIRKFLIHLKQQFKLSFLLIKSLVKLHKTKPSNEVMVLIVFTIFLYIETLECF